MAKPLATKTLKVLDHFRKHPNASVSAVAGKYDMATSQVYKLRKLAQLPPESDLCQRWRFPATDRR